MNLSKLCTVGRNTNINPNQNTYTDTTYYHSKYGSLGYISLLSPPNMIVHENVIVYMILVMNLNLLNVKPKKQIQI